MPSEQLFCDLFDKYGDDFNWYMIPLTQSNGALVTELKKELGENHSLYNKAIYAAAKCMSNDDVLYVADNGHGGERYYIFHLTYSLDNADGFPRCREYDDIEQVVKQIENDYLLNYR